MDDQLEQPAEAELSIDEFDYGYRLRMILAYPVIADMTAAQLYTTPRTAKDWAFQRILANRNLQVTHRRYLADRAVLRDRALSSRGGESDGGIT